MHGINPLVLGVLGGMGSYSTLHFFERVLDAFPVDKEWERPRVVIDNNCVLPSRVRALLYDERRDELVRGMAASIAGLLRYAPHAIAIPCHTAHCFLPEVRRELGDIEAPIVDMIELTVEHCRHHGAPSAALLATEGTIATHVYEDYGDPRGVGIRHPNEAGQARTREFIEQVKKRRDVDAEGFVRFVESLGAPAVILGCTELSVLFDAAPRSPAATRVIDPLALMVERIHALSSELTREPEARAEP
ncbi:MAG: aspartate/glutamate racemase family protein [Myxococcota bacterium]